MTTQKHLLDARAPRRRRPRHGASAAIAAWLGLASSVLGCDTGSSEPPPPAAPSASATPRPRPELVAVPADVTDGPTFLARELARARGDGRTLLVAVGASWCEPCRRFHEALSKGELDRELSGARVVELDLDVHGAFVASAGCTSRMVPLFARVTDDGRCGPRRVEGGIKGPGAVGFLAPKVAALLGDAASR